MAPPWLGTTAGIGSRDQEIRKNTGFTTKLDAVSDAWDRGKIAPGLMQLSAN